MTPRLTARVLVRRFLFTYNSSTCGRLSNFTGDERELVAVLVPTGAKANVALLTGLFFALSAAFSGLWVLGAYYEPLGQLLYTNLQRAFAPFRWIEYTASASGMSHHTLVATTTETAP